ncbi:SETMR methyltransferase, partial [Pseudoatta argentina]
MRKLSARWVPRLLTVDHKRDRVTISKQYLEMFQRNPDEFLRRFITVDETWIHYFTPETKEQSKQWTSPSESAPMKAKIMKLTGKQTINGDYYAALLDRFNILKKKRPHLAKKKVLFHQCTSSHVPGTDGAKFNEFRYELLPHPARFSPLRLFHGGKRFITREINHQLITEIKAYFEELDKSYYSDDLKKLENRWIKCIELKGDYIEIKINR